MSARPSTESLPMVQGKATGDDDSIFLPRRKTPKNQRERQSAAKLKLDMGHVANPLGGPDNRPHRCKPSLARNISPDGNVTVSQLYRHASKLYERAFGPGVFEGMMPSDRQAVGSMFGELQQRFIDCCEGMSPSYRDLAEYLDWFMEPQHLGRILSASKYCQDGRAIVHFRQVMGAAYVRRFYDEVLKRRNPPRAGSDAAIGERREFWEEAFRRFRESQGSNWLFCQALASFGYAVAAQFLAEEYGSDESLCRQKILLEMERLLSESKEPEEDCKYLGLAWKATEEYSKYLDEKCILYNWREKASDLLDVACERAGLNQAGLKGMSYNASTQ